MKSNVAAVLMLLFASVTFAGVDVTGYSVSPSTIRPGLTGTISVTLENGGTDTVFGTRVVFSASGFTFTSSEVYVGDLSSGGKTTITVPFTVSKTLPPGAYNILGKITWVGSASGDSGPYKLLSVPVNVESDAIVQAENVTVTNQPIIPGEAFELAFVLHNTGSGINDVVISSNSSTFVMTGQSRVLLNDLSEDEKKMIILPFTANTAASAGTQQLPLTVEYTDALGQSKTTSIIITPISVEERNIDFFVSTGGLTGAKPGSIVKVSTELSNIGNDGAYGVVAGVTGNSSVFTPIGPSEVLVGNLLSGEKKLVEFTVGINGEAAAGYYPLVVSIDYRDRTGASDDPVLKRIGIEVVSRDEISAIATTKPSVAVPGAKQTVSLRFFNVGTNELRGVSARVESDAFDVIGSSQEYIGSITLDNPETVQFEVFMKKDAKPGKQVVKYTLDYVDAYNVKRQMEGTAYFSLVSPEVAASYNGNGATNPLLILGMLVVVAIVLWFAYTRFVRKKK